MTRLDTLAPFRNTMIKEVMIASTLLIKHLIRTSQSKLCPKISNPVHVCLIFSQNKTTYTSPLQRKLFFLHSPQNTKQSPKKDLALTENKICLREKHLPSIFTKTPWKTFLPLCFTDVSTLYNHFSCRSVRMPWE